MVFSKCSRIFCLAGLLLGCVRLLADQTNLTAFPGAEGFGANASGGRGGDVYHVINLNDNGPGSLRAGAEQVPGPRTVVFDVGGYISLQSVLHLGSNLTIAGQTAPGDGIGLRNSEVSLSGSQNVIVQYVRIRQGLVPCQEKKSAVNMFGAHDIIFDHVSIQWGRWDTVDMNGCTNVTFQDCIIGPGVAPQRFGCLCQSWGVSFIRNLWINNQSRNPKAKGLVQYINNVVYNWGVAGFVGGHSATNHWADVIGNYFIKGPSSSGHFVGEFRPTDQIYQTGNYADLDCDGKLDGRPVVAADFGMQNRPTLLTVPTAEPQVPVAVLGAAEAYQKVLAGAGDSLRRDSVDRQLLNDLASLGSRGHPIRDPEEMGGFGEIAGGTARTDSNGDGIPDAWKIAHGLPVNSAGGNKITAASGRTQLEEYLNWLTLPRATASLTKP